MCLAIPGKIKEIQKIGPKKIGKVNFDGLIKEIYLDYIPESKIGDYIIAHDDMAIKKLNEEEAKDTIEIVKEAEKSHQH